MLERSASRSGRASPTFGIVTALPEEFVAMRTMLENASRRYVPDDRADYVVGTVPSVDPDVPHQVVLTTLGSTGNDAAAAACTNLVRSFGSVRCVLMVGIAAGVPRPRDPDRQHRAVMLRANEELGMRPWSRCSMLP